MDRPDHLSLAPDPGEPELGGLFTWETWGSNGEDHEGPEVFALDFEAGPEPRECVAEEAFGLVDEGLHAVMVGAWSEPVDRTSRGNCAD